MRVVRVSVSEALFEQRIENRRRTSEGAQRYKSRDHLNVNLKINFYITAASATFVLMMPNPMRGQTPQHSVSAATPEERAPRFDQEKALRHFKLLPDGGALEITANDPGDVATIRQEVANIAAMFGQGKFEVPTLTRPQNAPGVERMSQLKSDISYTAENLPAGGRVRITTTSSEARNAVHDFLRFQIQEHKTGDSLAEPEKRKGPHPANNLGHDARPAPP